MKKSESQNSLHSENKLEKILGHVIINEFDASTKCYYNRKKIPAKIPSEQGSQHGFKIFFIL